MSDRFECELNHAQGTWKCAKKEYEAELERLRKEVDRQLGRHLCYTGEHARRSFWRAVDAALGETEAE